MSDVETTDKQKTEARQSQVLIIKVLGIIEKQKGMKKWKYNVVDNHGNKFLMQTTIEPREFPVTLKVGKKYFIPIVMYKSGKVGNVDGQYMELIENYDEELAKVSTIPVEEQGGNDEQIAKITANDQSHLVGEPYITQEMLDTPNPKAEIMIKKTKKEYQPLEEIPKPLTAMEKMEESKQRFLESRANDKPSQHKDLNSNSGEGAQLAVTDEDEFHYQDRKDEDQIIDEIKGRMIDEYVYQFDVDIKKNGIVVGKRTVTGVSYAGIKALVTGRGGYSITTNTIVEVNGIWYAKVIIHDNVKDLDGLGMGECSLGESFARQKAMGKALRNAYRSAIDEGRFKAFCLQWLEENKK